MNSDRRLRKRNLSCNKEGGLRRREYMHKGGRCSMWNEDTDGVMGLKCRKVLSTSSRLLSLPFMRIGVWKEEP